MDTGVVNETDAGAFPEACRFQKHGQGHETTWHDPQKRLYENLFGNRCLHCPHTCRVIMLEVAVCVEMETC